MVCESVDVMTRVMLGWVLTRRTSEGMSRMAYEFWVMLACTRLSKVAQEPGRGTGW